MSQELLQEFQKFKASLESKVGTLDAEMKAKYSDIEKELLRPDFGGRRREPEIKSVGQQVVESDAFREWKNSGFAGGRRRLIIDLPDRPLIERKALLLTTGLVSPVPDNTIDQLPRMSLRLRDLLDVRPMTSGGKVDYLRQVSVTSGASPQVEGEVKGETDIVYEPDTATARTIAHHTTVSRQALDDIEGLQRDINDVLLYELLLKEEGQILAGNGVGVSINGIITQAANYDTAFNVAGDTKLDRLRHAILQVALARGEADGIVLNPRDLHDIELLKDENGGSANTGRYIVGDPKTGGSASIMLIWSKPVVESTAISYGQFVVGAFRRGARLHERRAASVEISFEHGNNFTMNLATILCEERIALAVRRPGLFVEGQF